MSPRQRKLMTVCLVILVVSMAIMAVNTIIDISRNGRETFDAINIFPFISMAVVLIIILANNKKK
jgi:surface polysaccharide O-acyltransferase-like enzyme